MWLRFLFLSLLFWLVTVSVPPLISAQQPVTQQLLEELKVVPSGLIGEWKIGDKTFTVNQQTIIDKRVLAEPGSMAAVLYVRQNESNVAIQIQPLPIKVSDLDDGPYVLWQDKTTAEVITFSDGKVERTVHENIQNETEIRDLPCPESTITLDPNPPVSPKSVWEQPTRLMAISDLEGNYTHAKKFLQTNGVIDGDGHWIWGDGHLVLIGDLIDRGMQVTELMWLIRRLERESAKAGGQVHYILGNHEAMVMAGDLRYIHPKYVFTAQRIGLAYDQLFNQTSDIGRWWRSKNGVETIGDLLFVHGGYSPMLDQAGLDIDTLNKRIRGGLSPMIPAGDSPDLNPVGHQHGPFWYRGYFDQHAATWGKATSEEIRKILDRHNAKHIVIGHTVVPHVGPLDETGQVIGIDVQWSHPQKGEGLLQEDGKLWRVTMFGEKTEIDH